MSGREDYIYQSAWKGDHLKSITRVLLNTALKCPNSQFTSFPILGSDRYNSLGSD